MTCDDRDDWEAVGRSLLADRLFNAHAGVSEAFAQLQTASCGGEDLTTEDVREARRALDQAHYVLEDEVVPIVPGVESWERAPSYVPYRNLRQWATPGEGDEETES